MVLHRTVSQFFLLSIICTCLNAADSLPSITASAAVTAPAAIEEDALPIFQVRDISSAILDVQLNSLRRSRMLAGCKVAPLTEVWDPEVLAFEKNAETAPV